MVLVAICVVFYNPAFFPMAQTELEFEELALTLPTSGSADGKAKVFLFNEEIDVKTLLQPVTLERLAVLREELKAQEAADEKKNQAEEGEGSDTGALKGEESEPETEDEEGKDDNEGDSEEEVDEEQAAQNFRAAVKEGDQVALLVDQKAEGLPFLVGEVLAEPLVGKVKASSSNSCSVCALGKKAGL